MKMKVKEKVMLRNSQCGFTTLRPGDIVEVGEFYPAGCSVDWIPGSHITASSRSLITADNITVMLMDQFVDRYLEKVGGNDRKNGGLMRSNSIIQLRDHTGKACVIDKGDIVTIGKLLPAGSRVPWGRGESLPQALHIVKRDDSMFLFGVVEVKKYFEPVGEINDADAG